MARKDSRVYAIDSDRMLGATRDRATHQAAIVTHLLKIVPEFLFFLIELTSSIMDLTLFTDHRGQIRQTIVDEARNKCLIAAVNLSVGFLDKRYPELGLVSAAAENECLVA